MRTEQQQTNQGQVNQAVEELRELISQHYPTATFQVGVGDDPPGTYLTATVDVDDPEEVVDVFIDRLLELQIEEELPIYVIPVRTPERVARSVQAAVDRARRGYIPFLPSLP